MLFPANRRSIDVAIGFDSAIHGGRIGVITRYRGGDANLRTQLERIIRKAGLEPWPKLFHNLRATRETELAESSPLHVVCAWIGNSQPIAAKHYLQVTDDHFLKATGAAKEAAQKAAQHTHAEACTVSHDEDEESDKTLEMQANANTCGTMHMSGMPPEGLEPSRSSAGNVPTCSSGGSNSGNKCSADKVDAPDPELAAVLAAWPGLPLAIRAGIAAMVRASAGQEVRP